MTRSLGLVLLHFMSSKAWTDETHEKNTVLLKWIKDTGNKTYRLDLSCLTEQSRRILSMLSAFKLNA